MAFAAFAAPVLASAATGLIGKLFGGGSGGGDKMKKLSTMSPQQQQLLNSLLGQMNQGGGGGQALSTLQSYLNPSQQGFEQFADPYMQQFQSKVLPGIAERFAGAGALSSSGFGQAIGGASSDLQSQLAQLYSGRQQQSAQSLLGFGQNLLSQQPFAYHNKQGGGTMGQGFAQGLSGALPGLLSSLFQGGGGGAGGGQGNYQFPLTGMYENMFRSGAGY